MTSGNGKGMRLFALSGDGSGDPTLDRRRAIAMFAPDRLAVARMSHGWTRRELAERVEVTPTAISQYESGKSKPGEEVLQRMALVLGFPLSFFRADGTGSATLKPAFFRSLRKMKADVRDRGIADLELLDIVIRSIDQRARLPVIAVPRIPMTEGAPERAISDAAHAVRDAWKLPRGPVGNIVRLLESKGVVVVRTHTGSTDNDAYSRWGKFRPIIVLASDKGDVARSRFDAAHELGHIVMHNTDDAGSKWIEDQANAFAAAFLMPQDDIEPHLPARADWNRLATLKHTWGVSMQALVYHARRLGVMTEFTHRRAVTEMSKLGWHRNEPAPITEPERPVLLARAIQALEQADVPLELIANDCGVSAQLVLNWLEDNGDERPRVSLEPV